MLVINICIFKVFSDNNNFSPKYFKVIKLSMSLVLGLKVIPKVININYIITMTIAIVVHVVDTQLIIIGFK